MMVVSTPRPEKIVANSAAMKPPPAMTMRDGKSFSTNASVEVGPRGTGAATFRLRAVAPGSARVRVDATSTAEADAIERIVVVRPKARAQVETVHGTLSPDRPFLAALPVVAAAVHTERRASLYGSPLADVLGGFEGLIACPHG